MEDSTNEQLYDVLDSIENLRDVVDDSKTRGVENKTLDSMDIEMLDNLFEITKNEDDKARIKRAMKRKAKDDAGSRSTIGASMGGSISSISCTTTGW